VRTIWPVTATLAVVALTAGCTGAAQPGVAASVGDETVSMSEVDTTARDYCAAREGTFRQEQIMLPMSQIRNQTVSSLVVRGIADRMAEEYDVEVGPDYSTAVQQLEQQSAGLSEEKVDAIVAVEAAGAYIQTVATAAAEQELADEGVTAPSQDEVLQRAIELYRGWPARDEIDFDPRFGLTFTDGQFVADDRTVSVPVSQAAVDGSVVDTFTGAGPEEQQALQEEMVSYARSLPPEQRCG
jgi:hypothetical protein